MPVATATRYRLWVDDNSNTNPRVQVDLTPAAGRMRRGRHRVPPQSRRRARGRSRIVVGARLQRRRRRAVERRDGLHDRRRQGTGRHDHHADDQSPRTPSSATTIALGGTASDDVGVVQVTWSNDRGGAGSATGTVHVERRVGAAQPGRQRHHRDGA